MAKKKRSGGGGGGGGDSDCGGGGGGQQPKPVEEAIVGDHADENDKDKNKGKKAPPQVVTAVLKVDMHCDGCAKRIRASVRHYPGVEGVAVEADKGTMTVVGRVDAKKLRDRVANKTKKKVELVCSNNNQQNQNNKGKDDEAACNKKQQQQQQSDFKVHEYGKPDYMCDLYWLDKVYGGYNKAVQDKAKEDNKACGGGGGGKAKEDKGSGGGGEGNKDKQDNKGSGGGKGKDDDKSCGGGGEKGKGCKDNKKPAVPVVGTVVLKVGAMGLHCDGCMNRIRTKLFKIKGVEQVAMDMAKNLVTVTGTMDIKGLPGKLQKKVRRPVDVVQPNKEGKDKESKDKDGKTKEGCKDGKEKDKDASTKAEVEFWKTAFYDQHPLLSTEFMLSDENPNACSVM